MKHIFDVEIAEKIGIHAAIILENIGYWIKRNEANKTKFFDGTYWTYNSRRAYKELFPYMSERQINTAFEKLISEGYIITGNYNDNAYDRTLWYALTQKGKCILHFDIMDNTKMSNGIPQNDIIENHKTTECIYTDINTIINTNINADINKGDGAPSQKAKKPERHKHGEYNHVLLSDAEYDKLCNDYGQATADAYIKKVDEYCEMSGKSYKNYNLAIRNTFMKRDNVKPLNQSTDGLTLGADGWYYDKNGDRYI